MNVSAEVEGKFLVRDILDAGIALEQGNEIFTCVRQKAKSSSFLETNVQANNVCSLEPHTIWFDDLGKHSAHTGSAVRTLRYFVSAKLLFAFET